MQAVVFSFSQKGFELGNKIKDFLKAYQHSFSYKEQGLTSQVGLAFKKADCIVFVGAAGIAVRSIAPFVKSKEEDPAVIVVDELGGYVIPILSGHLGGANQYANCIAKFIGAVPVITTATDINRVFAVDTWAKAKGLKVINPKEIKHISAALLRGEKIGFKCDYAVKGELPEFIDKNETKVGIVISNNECRPFENTLRLCPQNLALGVGSRKNIKSSLFRQIILQELCRNNILVDSIFGVASINLKAEEKAILDFCENQKIPFITYSAEELARAKGSFAPSPFVKSVTGVDNVCQRSAAILSAGGKMMLGKVCSRGATLAVYEKSFVCDFN